MTSETLEFSLQGNWETARGLAVEHAVEMKEQSAEEETYSGIQLTLELVELDGSIPRALKVLTGAKMHSEDILKALDSEREIYEGAGIEVQEMVTKFEGKEYRSLIQHFVKFYYFTEAKPYK